MAAATTGTQVRRAEPARRTSARRLTPYLMVTPALALVVALALVPLLYGVYLSFTDWFLLDSRSPSLEGVSAYARIYSDPAFWAALLRTVLWTLGTLVIEVGVGLPLALLLNVRTPATGVLTGFMLLPWITPFVVVAYAWTYLLDGTFGPLHAILEAFGLVREMSPLGDPTRSLLTLTFISGWKGVPFMTVALLAARKAIPIDLYEASAVDSAGPWQQFRYITLPHLRNTIVVMSIAMGVLAFYSFDLVWIMTRGGPADTSKLLGISLYQAFFTLQAPGTAAAIGVTMLLALAVGAVIAMRFRKDAT